MWSQTVLMYFENFDWQSKVEWSIPGMLHEASTEGIGEASKPEFHNPKLTSADKGTDCSA